ncbi:Pentatricopeptide repeat-containing protein At3g29290 (Protein EMBRYO DEFECTIVE 2076) [Durusdinium trenchii]|uniref:Pentatricopeptide repeat-containing protein At3g29290 (Protein EMBRYO DEFECTIVE 2076) n=1 Tax=Durusdinium trenchii TaxID=1381693 RepID=A0ABP0I347_9DINO
MLSQLDDAILDPKLATHLIRAGAEETFAKPFASIIWMLRGFRAGRLELNVYHCSAAMTAFHRAERWMGVCQQWTRACSFMEFMTRSALKINVIVGHTVLAALTLGSIWRFTLRQAFRLQECGNLDCKAIVASIDSMSKAYRWELPLSLFMLHRRDCPQNMGCVPSNAALAACGQGNGWDVVLNLFGGMAAQALVPDEITWGTLVSCLEQGARWQFALHLLACDREGLAKRSEICTNSAASCCEKACHWQSTLSLVHCLRHFRTFPGSISCNVCVSSCRNVGAWWWAVQGLVDMHSRQLVTEVSSSEATIAVLPEQMVELPGLPAWAQWVLPLESQDCRRESGDEAVADGTFTAAVAQWTHEPELLNNLATSLAALSQEVAFDGDPQSFGARALCEAQAAAELALVMGHAPAGALVQAIVE